jgi:FkbM family methyltransferase
MLANRCDIYIGRALIEYGEYCELETQYLLKWISQPGTIVEIGANIGSQTIALARRAKAVGGNLVAFEPQPFVFQNLCANLALNGLENVTAWPFACAPQAGTVWLDPPNYLQHGNFGGVSVRSEVIAGGIQVPCVRLDDLLRDQPVTLLKVDVEGFELQVLEGAREILSRHRPVLYIENDRVAQSPALIEFLQQRGYRLWWHIVPLFNPQNFRGKAENCYPKLSAFNMVGVAKEHSTVLHGLEEIVDAMAHPLAQRHA